MNRRNRIFIAINLPQDIKKFLASYQRKWSRSQGDRGSSILSGPDLPAKWIPMENLHITLVFLGDVSDEELGEVCITVKEVVKNHHSFEINLMNITYGTEGKLPPKMLWAIGQKSKELSLLEKDLEESLLQKVNFNPEHRAFSPHVNLARIKEWEWRAIEPEERPEISETIDLEFTVESVDIMQSEPKKGGAQYTIIESHQLQ